jgi:hypothetical protein
LEQESPPSLEPVPATVAVRWLSPLIRVLHERHEDMLALVSGLPPGGLQWQAADEMASLGGIAARILLVEDYAIHAVAGESLEGWMGTNGQGMDAVISESELCARIVAVDRHAKALLCDVDEQQLLARHEGNGRSLFDVLVEEVDHVAMHYGQMQIARQLFEDAHPEFLSGYEHWR